MHFYGRHRRCHQNDIITPASVPHVSPDAFIYAMRENKSIPSRSAAHAHCTQHEQKAATNKPKATMRNTFSNTAPRLLYSPIRGRYERTLPVRSLYIWQINTFALRVLFSFHHHNSPVRFVFLCHCIKSHIEGEKKGGRNKNRNEDKQLNMLSRSCSTHISRCICKI